MIVVPQVAELVRDHVLDAMNRHLNEPDIQGNATGRSTAAPAPLHVPHTQRRFRYAMPGCHSVTLSQISLESSGCVVPIPKLHESPNVFPILVLLPRTSLRVTAVCRGVRQQSIWVEKRTGCNAAACALPGTGGEGVSPEEDCCLL